MKNAVFWETIIQPKDNIYIFPIVIIISIKDNEIIIDSFMYGRKISINNILVNEIQRINLNDPEYNI